MFYDTQGDVTKTGIKLLLEEPFYGHVFSGLLRKVGNDTDSISISVEEKHPALVINAEYWNNIDTDNVKYGLLKHQLLHLSLKHPFMRERFQQKNIFDMAADLVVNQYIHPMHLPNDAITLDKYPKLKNLKKGESVGYYYLKILEIQEKDDNPDAQFPDENNEQLKQHQNWNSFGQMPRMEQRMMESALEDTLVQAAERTDDKLQGHLPSSLYRLLQERMSKSKQQVDWRRMLRIFIGTGKRTYLKNTIRRPSKRYGTTPGIKVKQRQKILVGLDTSGSVSPEELAVFFSEMSHIQRQGVEIMVAECDSTLQRTYILGTYPSLEVKGGGGTNFTPVIAFANDNYKPDAIVYFTDGYGNTPSILPQCSILWLISETGIEQKDEQWQNLIGRKVKMSK
jgi:predicted metal-dependent peptidase